MVLVEEELVVIDLQTEGWPVIQTPYLVPLHSSAITCSHHVSAIPLKLWERLLAAGQLQITHYSPKVSLPGSLWGGHGTAVCAPSFFIHSFYLEILVKKMYNTVMKVQYFFGVYLGFTQ